MPIKDPTVRKKYRREYYERNRDKEIRNAVQYNKTHPEWYEQGRRNARLKKYYGIGLKDYEKMLTEQGNVCAVCKKACVLRLSVDHCHKTGRVRGLLCRRCNQAIGLLSDDPGTALALYNYLK
jgi:coenzyme F420-reducing hydrogenase beta subunit